MDKEFVFNIIKDNVVDIVPELASHTIMIQDSLKELGANSIDRAEIIIKSMAALQIKAPLVDFAKAKNIEELVDLFLQKKL